MNEGAKIKYWKDKNPSNMNLIFTPPSASECTIFV